MTFTPFQVKVPATTANLGPGFDSIGLAINLYQNVYVQPSFKWEIKYENESHQLLSIGDDNLIMSTIKKVEAIFNKTAPEASLTVHSSIPLSRGLGSSAAAIAAGITIAEQLLGLDLSDEEKVKIASDIEGHPDNVSAALVGGLTVSRYEEHELDFVKLPAYSTGILILIPNQELSTATARTSIPAQLPHSSASSSSAAANVMLSAIMTGDWKVAGRMMEKDKFHEPYRIKWIHSFEKIRDYAKSLGAYGCTISGAGPSIILFAEKKAVPSLQTELQAIFPEYSCIETEVNTEGTTVTPIFLKQNLQPPI
ncbi:homoserine kinase [Jeotgalibacillus sp. S-D1]|uniref:homoserine kinase n=1 Tax=Jeotgalibacillus sp. S-D1 TaxID=2552189 RepID=UPI001059650F|nr:homoserine kinase [Jeotgalibacillus sp. S-D1]TDL34910.1 homoserine kinase [Jeotgalibacillus sp. S-D1]